MAASMDCAMQAEALLSSDDQHNVTNNLHNEQRIPIQGKSIQSDLIIKGPKIYSDAAFRTSKIPGALRGQVGTGIGIYFSLLADHGELNIQIQASSSLPCALLGTRAAESARVCCPSRAPPPRTRASSLRGFPPGPLDAALGASPAGRVPPAG